MDAYKTKKTHSSEKGQAIALMVLALTALIAIVALAVDGGRLYYAQRTAQNAADNASLAGALARCQDTSVTTAAFNSAAINGFNNDGTSNTVTVNSPPLSGPNTGDWEYVEVTVNSVQQPGFAQIIYSGSLETTVRATASCDLQLSFEHAIFGGSETCANTVSWAASNTIVNGGVHSNNDMLLSGTGNTINGIVDIVDGISGPGNATFIPATDNPITGEVEPYPLPYQIADYEPGGASAVIASGAGEYHYIDGDWNMAALVGAGLFVGNDMADGLYFATGDIDLTNNVISAPNVTLVAEGTININGSNQLISHYMDGLMLFSNENLPGASSCSVAAISMSGSTNDWAGIIFAPTGLVSISGASATTYSGGIFAGSVSLSGSNLSISVDQSLLPAPPPELNLAE
jgi:Flp pilus assembly protein TadG